ncbi:MAG: MarR family transcriptional regulator [Moraxellaceae bacterium]|nr:MarR family transcriptional regulator [Pseudobdellovibrionaceae bacterium]
MPQKNILPNYQDETKVHPALIKYCGYCLNKATVLLRTLMNQEMQAFNLTTVDLALLKIIEEGELISQIQLGDQLGIDKASMVKLIDSLEKRKMVERLTHPSDRRVKNLQLTKMGKKTLGNCQKAKLRAEKKFFQPLNLAEEKAFREIIKKLIPAPVITASVKK